MSARLATIGPSDEEYQQIIQQLNDWEWLPLGGRPRKRLPAEIARAVEIDLVKGINKSAIVRKYSKHYPFSRKWLKRVSENGRLAQMATGGSTA